MGPYIPKGIESTIPVGSSIDAASLAGGATPAAETALKGLAQNPLLKTAKKFLDPAKTLLSMERRTEEQKAAMGIEKGRKRLYNKLRRQEKRGKISDATMAYKSALSADPGNTMSRKGYDLRTQKGPDGSMANERELARQADAGERVISDNIEKAAKAALQTTSSLVGGIPGAVINAGLSGMDAAQSGEDGGMAFAKSIGKSAVDMYGGQLLAKGEQAFLANRAMKEADRLGAMEDAFDISQKNYLDDIAAGGDGSAFEGRMDSMADRLVRRQERFKIAQNKANAGTTALGNLARGLDKTGLFNKLVQGNNIIQNESGLDPQAAAVANPSGPAYTPQPTTPPPDPFMVNTLYNPLPQTTP